MRAAINAACQSGLTNPNRQLHTLILIARTVQADATVVKHRVIGGQSGLHEMIANFNPKLG